VKLLEETEETVLLELSAENVELLKNARKKKPDGTWETSDEVISRLLDDYEKKHGKL